MRAEMRSTRVHSKSVNMVYVGCADEDDVLFRRKGRLNQTVFSYRSRKLDEETGIAEPRRLYVRESSTLVS